MKNLALLILVLLLFMDTVAVLLHHGEDETELQFPSGD